MAGLKDIKRRIRSVTNTTKITYAMKLVSAAKLRKAQDAVKAAREYTDSLGQLVGQVLRAASSDSDLTHPLMEERTDVRSVRIIVVGGSRGLCGAFNSNLNKKLSSAMVELGERYPDAVIDTMVLGKKPREHIIREQIPCIKVEEDLPEDALQWPIEDVAREVEDAFTSGAVDAVYLVYTKFKSAMTQIPTLEQLLPLKANDIATAGELDEENASSPLVIFEPSPEEVFYSIVPRILRTRIQQGALDTKASEHGSRMVAMDSATKNAGELNQQLKLTHNKLRQGAITAELLDIIGGAEAV